MKERSRYFVIEPDLDEEANLAKLRLSMNSTYSRANSSLKLADLRRDAYRETREQHDEGHQEFTDGFYTSCESVNEENLER